MAHSSPTLQPPPMRTCLPSHDGRREGQRCRDARAEEPGLTEGVTNAWLGVSVGDYRVSSLKSQRGSTLARAPVGPPFERRACASCRPQGGAAGGGARARPDGPRMRVPQLARYSRDQLRRRMGQHGAALGSGRGGRCEVFRAPPSFPSSEGPRFCDVTRVI